MVDLLVILFAGSVQGPIFALPFDNMDDCREAMPKAQVWVNDKIKENMHVKIVCEPNETSKV